jgi:hypothetical protein
MCPAAFKMSCSKIDKKYNMLKQLDYKIIPNARPFSGQDMILNWEHARYSYGRKKYTFMCVIIYPYPTFTSLGLKMTTY